MAAVEEEIQKDTNDDSLISETGILHFDIKEAELVASSFSKFTFVFENYSDWAYCDSIWAVNAHLRGENNRSQTRHIKLSQNIWHGNGQLDVDKTIFIYGAISNINDPVIIDTQGYSITSEKGPAIKIDSGGYCVLTNSKANDIKIDQAWNNSTLCNYSLSQNDKNYIKYLDENGSYRYSRNTGVIRSTAAEAIQVRDSGSGIQIENGVGITSSSTGITATGQCKVDLYQMTLSGCPNTGIKLAAGAKLFLNENSIISLNSSTDTTNGGGGITSSTTAKDFAKSGSIIVMNEGSLISGNTAPIGGGISLGSDRESNSPGWAETYMHTDEAQKVIAAKDISQVCQLYMYGGSIINNTATTREGGGIAQQFNSGSRAILFNGKIAGNTTTGAGQWGGGGIFSSQGTFLWMPYGAEITNNSANGLGGGLTGCSTGKLLLDNTIHIYGNSADGSQFTENSSKNTDHWANPDSNVYNSNYRQGDHWKGQDIFGAQQTQVVTPEGMDYEGIADGQRIKVTGNTTVKSNQWLTLDILSNDNSFRSDKLLITNNTSTTHGGGVLINGWLVTGSHDTLLLGDDIGVSISKKIINLSGEEVKNSSKQFKFLLTDNDSEPSNIIARASVNGSGEFSFDSRITVKPETQSISEVIYYLSEDTSELDCSVVGDSTIYKLVFGIKESNTTTINMPVWNPQTETYESKIVIVKEYEITGLYIYIKEKADSNYKFLKSVAIQTKPVKEANLSDIRSENGTSATFINAFINEKRVDVEKDWEDGNEKHSSDWVTVYLKRYKSSDGDQKSTIVNAVTLNSDSYIDGLSYLSAGSAAGKGVWSYSWSNLPTVDSNDGKDYIYYLEEVSNNKLYSSEIIRDQLSFENGQQQAVTKTAEGWVKSSDTNVIKGKSYLLVSTEDNVALTIPDDGNNYAVNANHKTSLNSITLKDGGKAYLADELTKKSVFRLSDYSGKTNGLVNDRSANGNKIEHWLVRDYNPNSDKQGLYIGNSDNFKTNNLKEYFLENGNLKFNYDNESAYVTFANGMFGNSGYQGSNAHKVQVYSLQTVSYLEGKNEQIAIEKFKILNKKRTDIRYSLSVTKVDAENQNIPLQGAVFNLYQLEGNNLKLKFVESGKYSIDTESDQTELVTGENGLIEVYGLTEGVYYLEEIRAPKGYVLPTNRSDRIFKIDLTPSNSQLGSTNFQLTLEKILNNKQYYELPETGGSGTEIFKSIGSAMIIVAAVSYGFNRKKKRKEGEE